MFVSVCLCLHVYACILLYSCSRINEVQVRYMYIASAFLARLFSIVGRKEDLVGISAHTHIPQIHATDTLHSRHYIASLCNKYFSSRII